MPEGREKDAPVVELPPQTLDDADLTTPPGGVSVPISGRDGIVGVLTFTSPELSMLGKIVYAYITYTLMMMAYTAINIPYSALLGVITPDPVERASVSSVKFVFAYVAGTTVSLFFAFERTTIATTLIVFYTFPMWVAIAAVPVFGEHLGLRKLAAIGLSGVGLVLLLASPGTSHGIDALGVALALVASLCQTGFALVHQHGQDAVEKFRGRRPLRRPVQAFDQLFIP